MAAGYVLGLICVLSLVQGVPLNGDPAIVEDLRSADPTWASTRIVSGWEAGIGEIPYQGSLRMVSAAGAVSSCGCSLIHHRWVITAAHCLANRISFVVRFGLTNLTRPEVLVESTDKRIHPNYNEIQAGVQTADLALLGLNHDIEYSANIQPARLQSDAQKNINYAGVTLTVSGFGRTNDLWLGGAASEVLLWVLQRGVSNEECLSFYSGSSVIREQTICAGYYNVTSQSSCQGDSGGPLTVVDNDGERTMVGIVSFGHVAGCSAPIPSGYVRPGHYHDWYRQETGINFDWDSDASPEADDSSADDSSADDSSADDSSADDSSADDSSSDDSSADDSNESEQVDPVNFVN